LINKDSSFDNFRQANNLLKEKIEVVEGTIKDKEIATKLLDYFDRLEKQFEYEKSDIQAQVRRLNEKIGLMTDVITTQQNFTSGSFMTGEYSIEDILEDVLTMQADMLHRFRIKVTRDYNEVPRVEVQRTKLMHILINLVINAKDAMIEKPEGQRELKLSIKQKESTVHLGIADTGSGISDENFARIFTHGFTTKEEGHGFGLHNSANYLEEMKGKIWAESEGSSKGAIFNITLPIITGNSNSRL